MRKIVATLIFAVSLCALAAPALAGSQDEPCLSALPPGTPDPAVRDVHLHVQDSVAGVNFSACLVSNSQLPWRYLSLSFTVYSEHGVALNTGEKHYDFILPTYGAPIDHPALVLNFPVSIPLDLKYGKKFLNNTVVILQSQACMKPLPDCNESSVQTATFLLPVTIDP
jgi:hypothetical protein